MIEAGRAAPAFTLPSADGSKVSLKDFRGQAVVIYFYPKDDTTGCTTQACGIRDQWSEFQDAGAVVVGISPDSVASHARFAAKYNLPHILLADPDHRVIEKYGAWGEKKLYGRTYQGVMRSTVLVDRGGKVVASWPKVQPRQHADQVLEAIRALGQPRGR